MGAMPPFLISGFIGGSGYLLLDGCWRSTTGFQISLQSPEHIDGLPFHLWVPLLVTGLGLYTLQKTLRHPISFPIAISLGCLSFYLGLHFDRIDVQTARELGFIFPWVESSTLWPSPLSIEASRVNVDALVEAWPHLVITLPMAFFTVCFNSFGLQADCDLNQELRSHASSNLLYGLVGGWVGTTSLSRSRLNLSLGGNHPSVGLMCGLLTLALFIVFPYALAYLPIPVLNGLLFNLGANHASGSSVDPTFPIHLALEWPDLARSRDVHRLEFPGSFGLELGRSPLPLTAPM